jgi:hypothetical protein
MKFRYLLLCLVLAAAMLSACQSAPAQSQTYPVSTAKPANVPYPAPGASTVLYPSFKSGDEVQWTEALGMLNNGEVNQVLTNNAPKLTLVLKDGRSLVATEPEPGALQEAIQQCGEPCKTVEVK